MGTEVSQVYTMEDVQRAFPSRKGAVTQEAVDIINESISEPEFQGETLLQTATTYENILQKSKVGIKDYLNAIRFCSYMVSMDDNYTEAYKKTFWNRKFVQDRLDAPRASNKYRELTSAASRYRRSKLVVDLLTISQVPLDMLFTGHRYKALGVLADIMETGKLDRDRVNAAKELLAATKGPENIKMELDVGTQESTAVEQLNDQLAQMAARQKQMLEAGAASLKEYGSMKVKEDDSDIIEGEVE